MGVFAYSIRVHIGIYSSSCFLLVLTDSVFCRIDINNVCLVLLINFHIFFIRYRDINIPESMQPHES